MCQLTGMEVSNASMYDGASSLAEAVLMAQRITKRKKIHISQAIHPEYRRIMRPTSIQISKKSFPFPIKRKRERQTQRFSLDNLGADPPPRRHSESKLFRRD